MNMEPANKFRYLTQAILPVALLVYPFHIKSALVLLLIYLFAAARTFKTPRIQQRNTSVYVFLPVLLYVIYFISLIYTDNISHGLKDLETKAGLIIFPLIAYYLPREHSEIKLFKLWFVISFVIACSLLLFQAFYSYNLDGDGNVFYYDRFSSLMHPTYFTMYLTLALLFIIEGLSKKVEQSSGSLLILSYTALVLIVASMYLISSRAGIVIGWAVVGLMLIYLIYLKKSNVKKTMFAFLGSIILSVALLSPPDSRFAVLINEFQGKSSDAVNTVDPAKVDANPMSHRIILYRSATVLALDNPAGVGVGDVQDELVKVYREIGYEKAAEVRYNPHNQYLQTAVAVGWLGLIVLVASLFYFLIYGLRKSLMPLVGLVLILSLNGLFESVFEVQRGVLFFGLPLLFLLFPDDKDANN